MDQASSPSAPGFVTHFYKAVKRTRDPSASILLAADDPKCCRLSPEPDNACDLAERESGVTADEDGERLDPRLAVHNIVCSLCRETLRCRAPTVR